MKYAKPMANDPIVAITIEIVELLVIADKTKILPWLNNTSAIMPAISASSQNSNNARLVFDKKLTLVFCLNKLIKSWSVSFSELFNS